MSEHELKKSEPTSRDEFKNKILTGSSSDFKRNPMRHQWATLFEKHSALNPPPYHDGDLTTKFRKIKTKILPFNLNQLSKSCYSFIVTSSLAHEGVSTTAINLATSLSLEKGWHTIIVDACGLERSLTDQLKGHALMGLMDYLDNNAFVEQVIYSLPSPNLSIIPHGAINPCRAEFYASTKFQDLIHDIQKNHEKTFVVIDAPPMQKFSESQILSQYCDGILMVANKSKTPFNVFQNCIKNIPQDKLLGVILNQASLFSQNIE